MNRVAYLLHSWDVLTVVTGVALLAYRVQVYGLPRRHHPKEER